MVAGMEGKGEKRVGYLVEICCIIVAPWWIYGFGGPGGDQCLCIRKSRFHIVICSTYGGII